MGADMPELYLYADARIGEKDQPARLLTTLGWLLMGGKFKTNLSHNNASFNFWNRDAEVLDESIDRFLADRTVRCVKKG